MRGRAVDLRRIPTGGHTHTPRSYGWQDTTLTAAQKAAEWTPAQLSHESAVIVWRGEFGLQMGAVRSRTEAGKAGRTEDTYSASPFPGAWVDVPLSAILMVRHPQTI